MSGIDQSEEARAWLRAEIDAQCFGEEFGFDVVPQVGATPAGPVVQYAVIFTMRSPLLGRPPLLHVAAAGTPRLTPEIARQIVTSALTGLRALSAKVTAGAA